MIGKRNNDSIACKTVDDSKNIVIASRGLGKRALAADYVQRDAIPSAAEGHRVQSGSWVAPYAQNPLAGRTARDVASDVALKAEPEESLDEFGRGCFGGWVGPSRAFEKEANNSLDEGAGDQDEYSVWVVNTPDDDNSVIE